MGNTRRSSSGSGLLLKAVAPAFCVGYVIVAQRLGEQYPISRLSMWDSNLSEGGRVVVRSAQGLSEVSDFGGYSCEPPPDFSPDRTDPDCAQKGAHPEFDRIAEHYIRTHPAAPGEGESVTVGRRLFRRAEGSKELQESFCELTRCRATPKAGHGR